ncbi:hypothetical protein CCR75_003191 [Bremia lactucae]|uniref:Uncharacterized protein n=1 Tax=Bremia lactucae TaxID=4779 RepID=A0A976IEM3_BRELC|nr:hypothetical protein CCR75_003191 [Bremia lactucae]
MGFQELPYDSKQATADLLATTENLEKRNMRAMKKRLQDRLYQRKHRAKHECEKLSLEQDINYLLNEIAQLHQKLNHRKMAATKGENQRQHLRRNPFLSLQDNAQDLVARFFHVYQNGYSLPHSRSQERFLRDLLSTDVKGADLCGVDAFIQQWRLNGQYFALYVLEPQIWNVKSVGDQGVMVKVDIMLYLRCHRQSIGSLFPSLKTGHMDPNMVLLLVTGTTAIAGTYTFVFNQAGYAQSLFVSLQLLETLRRVVGSLQNVVQLTVGSSIALDSGTITFSDVLVT